LKIENVGNSNRSQIAADYPLIKFARNSHRILVDLLLRRCCYRRRRRRWRAPFSLALLLVLSRAPCYTVAGIYYVEYGAFGNGVVGGTVGGEEREVEHGGGGIATRLTWRHPVYPDRDRRRLVA